MKRCFGAVVVMASLALAAAGFAQTAPAAAPDAASAPASRGAAVPVALGKRMACKAASQAMQGQERRDQMQLCMMQAHLDCLKQAIDQKIVGLQRREFVKSCAE